MAFPAPVAFAANAWTPDVLFEMLVTAVVGLSTSVKTAVEAASTFAGAIDAAATAAAPAAAAARIDRLLRTLVSSVSAMR
jgi:hypothetical protein